MPHPSTHGRKIPGISGNSKVSEFTVGAWPHQSPRAEAAPGRGVGAEQAAFLQVVLKEGRPSKGFSVIQSP
jgi:hypothetical protein